MRIKFAHISDLHFGSFTVNPLQFFSKRWVGNFNYLLTRKKKFDCVRLKKLIDLFKREEVTHVLITGDLAVTSRKSEFAMAKNFIEQLKKEGLIVFVVPGNHDHYTKSCYKNRTFYNYFSGKFDPTCPFSLKFDQVTFTHTKEGPWIIALDTAKATALNSAEGDFSPQIEDNLQKVLRIIPKTDPIILMNHYPFFQEEPVKKQMRRGNELEKILAQHPNIIFYLHGHTHRQTVANLRHFELPVISNSGATPERKQGACHLITFDGKRTHLDVYRFKENWEKNAQHTFEIV